MAEVMLSSLGFEMKPFHGGILKILILRKIIFAKKLAIYLTSKNLNAYNFFKNKYFSKSFAQGTLKSFILL
jgi:hypothetical protein